MNIWNYIRNADRQYAAMLQQILATGTDTSDGEVRPIWEDTGNPAYTIKEFAIRNTYDLRIIFPLLTCRKIAVKSALDEMFWIYQRKSNRIADINSHIWDQWAKPHKPDDEPEPNEGDRLINVATEAEDGELTIGRSYGWQIAHKFRKVKSTFPRIIEIDPVKYNSDSIDQKLTTVDGKTITLYKFKTEESEWTREDEFKEFWLDQMDYCIHEIKYNPYSRRMLINLTDIDDIPKMNLDPCCDNLRFNVTKNENGDKVLNLELNQRSLDTIVAGGWDVYAHAMLLRMIAQVTGCIAGKFIHNITDAHIYDRHIEQAKALVNANINTDFEVWLNPEVKCFYDFTQDDVEVRNYTYDEKCTELCKNLPVAK